MKWNTLGIPIAIVVANYLLFAWLPIPQQEIISTVIYNVIRIVAIAYAGWLIARRGNGALWVAALAGLLLLAIDHIVLRGGTFLFNAYVLGETPQDNFSAFGGVLVSFVMFGMISIVVSVVGALAARWTAKHQEHLP
jgi:hypothetical protein